MVTLQCSLKSNCIIIYKIKDILPVTTSDESRENASRTLTERDKYELMIENVSSLTCWGQGMCKKGCREGCRQAEGGPR